MSKLGKNADTPYQDVVLVDRPVCGPGRAGSYSLACFGSQEKEADILLPRLERKR